MPYPTNPYYSTQFGAVPDQLSAYKQAYQPIYQPPSPPVTQGGNGMLWVQGEAAAKSWAVAPGASVVLWDSEAPYIYIKSADLSGIPSIRRLKWEDSPSDVPQNSHGAHSDAFAPMEEVRVIKDKIAALEARMEAMTNKKELEE